MNDQVDTEFIAVFHPQNHLQAGMIRVALEQANVNCYVDNETASSVRMGGVGIGAGSTTIMVPRYEAERALDIITGLAIEIQ